MNTILRFSVKEQLRGCLACARQSFANFKYFYRSSKLFEERGKYGAREFIKVICCIFCKNRISRKSELFFGEKQCI